MKISLESIDLATGSTFDICQIWMRRNHRFFSSLLFSSAEQMKKSSQSPSMIKSSSTTDKSRQNEEDLVLLNQINALAKTISFPHQVSSYSTSSIETKTIFVFSFWKIRLTKRSIYSTNMSLNNRINNKTTPTTIRFNRNSIIFNWHFTRRKQSFFISSPSHRSMSICCRERTETIDVLFLSNEHRTTWIKSFLQAKKSLCKIEQFSFVSSKNRFVSFRFSLTI